MLIDSRIHEGVFHIAMNDGKANVMNAPMLDALHAALDDAARADAIVALTSGIPGIFSAGFDMKVFASGDAHAIANMVRTGALLALKLLTFPRPVVTLCAGHAYPMGAFMVLASDVRLGVAGPHRIGYNEVAIGITVPSFAIALGRQRLSAACLDHAVTSGQMLTFEAAREGGFFDAIVDVAGSEQALADTIETLRRIDAQSHRATKLRLRDAAITSIRAAIEAEFPAAA